jgi:tetratricopeptide (TPR) repeat protein
MNHKIPPELETVCLKAMAREPSRRYPSAAELAEDLRRYLRGEPVRARPAGRVEKLWRWCRRKPALAVMAVALVLVLVGGLASSTALWLQAEANYRETGRQQQIADENFRQARQAVDSCLALVSEDELLEQPGMMPLRRNLLSWALRYYQNFQEQRADDPSLRQELAAAHLRSGTIFNTMGSYEEAKPLLRKAIAHYEQLQGANPGALEARAGLARSYKESALAQAFTNEFLSGEETAQRAIPLLEQLIEESPDDRDCPRLLGRCHDLIGVCRLRTGRFPAAEAAWNQAVAVLRRAAAKAADDKETLVLLALAYNNLSNSYNHMGQLAARDRAIRQAIELNQNLVNAHPDSARFRRALAINLANLGMREFDAGRMAASEVSTKRSFELFSRLVQQNPGVKEFEVRRAAGLMRVGEVKLAQGQTASARKFLGQAIALSEKILPGVRSDPSVRLDHAWARYLLGSLEFGAGDSAQALASCEEARAIQKRLVEESPDADDYRSDLLWSEELKNTLEVETGQATATAAVAAQVRIVQAREDLVKKNRGYTERQHDVAFGYVRLAELHLRGEDFAAALAALEHGGRVIEKVTQAQPDNLRYRNQQARTHAARARVLGRLGKTADARCEAERALTLGETLAREDRGYLVDLARYRALCAATALLGPSQPSAEEESRARQWAETAVKAIGDAVEDGYDNLHALNTHPELATLRTRDNFQKILARPPKRPPE